MYPRKVLRELSRYKIGTCAEMMYRNALFYGDKVCITSARTRLTFEQLNARVNRLVNGLFAMGLKKGDVIGVLSWNSARYLEVFGAAMKGGFIISPYNARLNETELRPPRRLFGSPGGFRRRRTPAGGTGLERHGPLSGRVCEPRHG